MDDLRINVTYEYQLSKSVSGHQVLKAVSDGVLKKMLNGKIMFHVKRVLKRLYYYKWRTWIAKFSTEKFLRVVSCTNPSFWGAQIQNYHAQKCLCSNTLKRTNWKFIFPKRVINWHVLQIAKTHFRNTIWFM